MRCSAELRRTVPTASDGALVIFVGQTRETPGTPAPGEEAAAARHAGEAGNRGSTTRPSKRWRSTCCATIGAEIEQRFGVRRLAIIHRVGRVALGEPSVVMARRGRPSGSSLRRCALRDRGAQGARADLEGGAIRQRIGVDRRTSAQRSAGWPGRGRRLMVKVYLSVDMEGLAGVSHAAPTRRGDDLYEQAVELMTGETNAAIAGAFAGGATEVTVNDSHGQMFNLPPEKLDERARLIEGRKPLSMVEGASDSKFDVALFVGYHARAGHPVGVIGHTYNPRLTLVRLNGRPATEAAVNALYLGAFGVPVGLVTGDDALAEEVADWLPDAERVVVKRALAFQSADSLHPARARKLIRDAAERAVARVAAGNPPAVFSMAAPIELRLEVATPGQAAMTAVMPGFERDGDREIVFRAREPIELFRALISAARMVIPADD